MKKIVISCLILALLISLAAPALASAAPFPDVTDETTRLETDVLRMLGVVGGDEKGNFNPKANLTRAEFCKMAVVIMGRGDEEPLYRNRTIFSDVRGTHWARGYINLAVSGTSRIIQGNGDGTFAPDENITYAQALTILMRVLGYNDADAGMLWPEGYLSLAESTGLSAGLEDNAANMPISRAEAAHLFCNMLRTRQKSGGYYYARLGSSSSNIIILEIDIAADDGGTAIRTSAGVFKTKYEVPESFLGEKGILIVDASGLAIGFIPDSQVRKTVIVSAAQASWITDSGGVKYVIPSTAKTYTSESKDPSTYGAVWQNIGAGARVTLYYSDAGTVDALYIKSSSYKTAMVAKDPFTGNPFRALLGGDSDYTIIKNGTLAKLTDLRQYDVATYDTVSNVLSVSDFRITGCYENAWPNLECPSKVKVLGQEFSVLPSAVSDFASLKLGQTITLLFTPDFMVAGAVTPDKARSNAVGIVTAASGSSASVTLLNGIIISGNPGLTDYQASLLLSEFVVVSSYDIGQIRLTRISGSGTYSDLDLAGRTLGNIKLSDGVRVYERVGKSALAPISLGELTQTVIDGSKVLFAEKDYSGKIGLLVLDDVTGDLYTYGFLVEGRQSVPPVGSGGTTYNRTVSVKIPGGTSDPLITGAIFTDGAPGGVVADASGTRAERFAALTEVKNVSRLAFRREGETDYVSLTNMELPIWKGAGYYNKVTGQWFKTLDEARAFSDVLTIYYDRLPEEGGKVRLVVVG